MTMTITQYTNNENIIASKQNINVQIKENPQYKMENNVK